MRAASADTTLSVVGEKPEGFSVLQSETARETMTIAVKITPSRRDAVSSLSNLLSSKEAMASCFLLCLDANSHQDLAHWTPPKLEFNQ